METWVVEVNYGVDTIETLYFSGEIDKEKIIEMMLYRVYKKGEWKELFDCVLDHRNLLIKTYKDDELVSIYHTDMVPDIEIYSIELNKMKRIGKHNMNVRREEHVPLHEKLGIRAIINNE